MSECQTYYTIAREQGICKECGERRYLKAGLHSSGQRGQPLKLIGPDLEKIKQWIKDAGWICQRCSLKVKVVVAPIGVKLKLWEPYPPYMAEIEAYIVRWSEVMRSGLDNMGKRPEAIPAFVAQYTRKGWVTKEEWYTAREQPTIEQTEQLVLQELESELTTGDGGATFGGVNSPQREVEAPAPPVELSGVGSNIES
jgi:hypothetical protein